jgi:hypothetical protein
MLDKYKRRLIDAGWIVEPGDPITTLYPEYAGMKLLWIARKRGVSLIVSEKVVRVVRGSTWSSTPMDVFLLGHILLPGIISEKYLLGATQPGDLIPHEGTMTLEELELRALLSV